MLEMVQNILGKINYIKIKFENDLTYSLFPLLYFTEKNLILYNKSNIDVLENSNIVSNLSDDDFEYVITGIIRKNENNLNVEVSDIKKYINRRKSKRYDVNKPAEFELNDIVYKGTIINLSESGALIAIDTALEIGDKTSVLLVDKYFSAKVLRKDDRTGKTLYGLHFDTSCDVIGILKKMKVNSFKNDNNVYVLLDNFDDLEHYRDIFDRDVSINFVNVLNNCDSFVVEYIENNKHDIIIIDMKESNIKIFVEKLKTYINIEKALLVLVEEDASDEIVNYLSVNKASIIFKPFLEMELKKILLKMSWRRANS